jgi:hypothetical protein
MKGKKGQQGLYRYVTSSQVGEKNCSRRFGTKNWWIEGKEHSAENLADLIRDPQAFRHLNIRYFCNEEHTMSGHCTSR